jgi:hypothetical protein
MVSRAVVVAQLEIGRPCVERRSDDDRSWGDPVGGRQPPLHLRHRGDRIRCGVEHDEPAVALAPRLHRHTAKGLDGSIDGFVVLLEGAHHHIGGVLPEPGAALHICEQERHDSGGKLCHGRELRFLVVFSPPASPHAAPSGCVVVALVWPDGG